MRTLLAAFFFATSVVHGQTWLAECESDRQSGAQLFVDDHKFKLAIFNERESNPPYVTNAGVVTQVNLNVGDIRRALEHGETQTIVLTKSVSVVENGGISKGAMISLKINPKTLDEDRTVNSSVAWLGRVVMMACNKPRAQR